MKPVMVGLMALLCLVGVSLAQFGSTAGGGGTGYSWLVLIGALFVLLFLFNRNSNFSGTTRLIYGNLTGTPTLTSG